MSYIAYQNLKGEYPEISTEAFENAVQFVDRDGRVYSGADAVARLFDYGLPGGRVARVLCANPPVIWFLRFGYRIVARHRQFFSSLFRSRRARRR